MRFTLRLLVDLPGLFIDLRECVSWIAQLDVDGAQVVIGLKQNHQVPIHMLQRLRYLLLQILDSLMPFFPRFIAVFVLQARLHVELLRLVH